MSSGCAIHARLGQANLRTAPPVKSVHQGVLVLKGYAMAAPMALKRLSSDLNASRVPSDSQEEVVSVHSVQVGARRILTARNASTASKDMLGRTASVRSVLLESSLMYSEQAAQTVAC